MDFTGEHSVSIDLKGRISIPAPFRDELRDVYQSESLFVTRSNDGGLVAYPPSSWLEICSKVKEMPPGPAKVRTVRNRIAPARECSFNAQGRIQIPQTLRNAAGLEKDVVVVGMFDKIEIWSQQAHAQVIGEGEVFLAEDAQGQAELGF